jgi:hypothetical protein
MKPANLEALRERARRALRNLYHNATPIYPRDFGSRADDFDSWLRDAAEQEIDYLGNGGAYGNNYRATLAHSANGGKLKSERARAQYIAYGMRKRELEQADCAMLQGWHAVELAAGNKELARDMRKLEKKYGPLKRGNSQWERINEYGKLYQWGRGGRTLAPKDLIRQGGGGSFSIREDYADELPAVAVVDLIRVVESFNATVESWCAGVPEMWREYCAELDSAERDERKAARKLAKIEAQRAQVARCFC